MTRLMLALALALASACTGPTLYVGSLGPKDAGSDGASAEDAKADDAEADDDSDDDPPCTAQVECAGYDRKLYCDVDRRLCKECLTDDHCRRDEHCERGDCED